MSDSWCVTERGDKKPLDYGLSDESFLLNATSNNGASQDSVAFNETAALSHKAEEFTPTRLWCCHLTDISSPFLASV